ARAAARVLGDAGIPVFIHSTGGYYDRREVLDALGLLSFLEDPSDDEVFILVCRSPWLGIPDTVLAQWGKGREKISYWDWLQQNPDEVARYPQLLEVTAAVHNACFWPLSILFEQLLEKLGLFEFCLVGDAS